MKIGILYYSFSGNTRLACVSLKEKLARAGYGVELVELKLATEEKNFFLQGKAASHREIPPLANGMISIASYDCIVLAAPVWAFTFAPALRSFLASYSLENKRCGCFLTCGAQITSGNALKELEQGVHEKGGTVFFSAYITGSRAGDLPYLEKRFAGLFEGLK
jgi:flavodoxin